MPRKKPDPIQGRLILSRRIGEKLLIGDKVTVQVVAIRNGHVQLGVQAPRDVEILRHELVGRKTA